MRLIPLAITAAMLAALLAGCAGIEGKQVANPATVLRFDPSRRSVEFENNKDVDVTLEEANFTGKDGQSFGLKNLVVKDQASTVRAANVPQINADADRIDRIYTGVIGWSNSVWAGVNELAATVSPHVPQTIMASALGRFRQVTTPWGGYTSGLSGEAYSAMSAAQQKADQAELVAAIKAAVKAGVVEALAPPTQPSP